MSLVLCGLCILTLLTISLYMYAYIHDNRIWNKGYCPYCGSPLHVEPVSYNYWIAELHCGRHGFLGFVHTWCIGRR